MKKYIFPLLLSAVLALKPAIASDVYNAHVILVSGHDLPDVVAFQIDQPIDACPAGTYLLYSGNTTDTATNEASIRAVYALLLAAKLSGQVVWVFGTNSSGPECTIRGIQLAR